MAAVDSTSTTPTTFTTIAPLPAAQQQDSSPGRVAGLPLAIGALIFLVVFLSVVYRARRNLRRPKS